MLRIWLRKEKLRLISIIRESLKNDRCKIIETDKKIVLFQEKGENYPEDYIEIEHINDKYMVSEVHRNQKQIKIETEKEEAAIYAIVLYKRLYDNIVDRIKARDIRSYMNAGEENKALECIISTFEDSVYSIDVEKESKISLIRSNDRANVKFDGEYLVENVSLSRGYVVLYNYCTKLHYITMYYDEMQKQLDCTVRCETIQRLYILGKMMI